jgi:hypothetical protein
LARKLFEEAYLTAADLGEKINTRLIFDGFAALAAEQGDHKRAAKLHGVADSLGATIGYAIEPAEQKFRDHYLDRLKLSLSAEEFASEYEAGKKMSNEEARKLARLSVDKRETVEMMAGDVGDQIKPTSDKNSSVEVKPPNYLLILSTLALVALVALIIWLWASSR